MEMRRWTRKIREEEVTPGYNDGTSFILAAVLRSMAAVSSSILSIGPPRADETGRVFFQPGGPPRDSSAAGRLGAATAKQATRSSSCSALPALLGAKSRHVGGRAGALCRGRYRADAAIPDQKATQDLLRSILLEKVPVDEAEERAEGGDADATPVTAAQVEDARADTPSRAASGAAGDSIVEVSAGLDPVEEELRRKREDLDQRQKDVFVSQICTSDTRHEVFDWVGKIYDLQKAKEKEKVGKKEKGRPGRRRTRSSGVVSDAGNSSTATSAAAAPPAQALGNTAGHSRFQSAGSFVLAVGLMSQPDPVPGSKPITQPVDTAPKVSEASAGGTAGVAGTASETLPEPSLLSGESLVVHREKEIGDISHELRMHAYLGGQLPELQAHVDGHIRLQSEAMSKLVDEELAETQLQRPRGPHGGFAFDGRAHFLRFQILRREVLRKKLEEMTPQWIWEGILTWDPSKPSRHKREDLDGHHVDFIYDNITKREGDSAARAKFSSKVTNEVPMFKPLHISYSMPHNWRDKYK